MNFDLEFEKVLKKESFKEAKEEKFSPEHLEKLAAEYGQLEKIDPMSPTYKKLIKHLDEMPEELLKQIADSKIKFLSGLARNRVKKTVEEALKKVELPDSNVEFTGLRMDLNGNKSAYFVKAGKRIKVQTNGNMPKTHSMGLKKAKEFSPEELKTIKDEFEAHMKAIGESAMARLAEARKKKVCKQEHMDVQPLESNQVDEAAGGIEKKKFKTTLENFLNRKLGAGEFSVVEKDGGFVIELGDIIAPDVNGENKALEDFQDALSDFFWQMKTKKTYENIWPNWWSTNDPAQMKITLTKEDEDLDQSESKKMASNQVDKGISKYNTESMKSALDSYLETMLWSSTDDNGEPLDKRYSISDIDPQSVEKAKQDLELFYQKAGDILDNYSDEKIAHDFWLTRNGHGAGFWDGDYEVNEGDGDKLTDIAHEFGEIDPYIGDPDEDGNVKIYAESKNSGGKEIYEGKTLNKPFRTPEGPKKFAVHVKNDKGNVVKVNFGDPEMEIKRDDPEKRKAFRARHGCTNAGPKWKAKYWSCKFWADKPVEDLLKGESQSNEAVSLKKKAEELGKAAFEKGQKSIPVLDKGLMDLIKANSKEIGDSIPLLKAWQKGWTEANLAAPITGEAKKDEPEIKEAAKEPKIEIKKEVVRLAADKMQEDHNLKVIYLDTVVNTGGDGIWSSKSKPVEVIQMDITYREQDGEIEGGKASVHFNKADWNVASDGLIYTDVTFLKELKEVLNKKGITGRIDYSELGMQGKTFVHFDVDAAFIKSCLEFVNK